MNLGLKAITGGIAGTFALVLSPVVLAQRGTAPVAATPGSARALAPVDLTGYWVSIVTEDWRFRMVTPPKGDYASVPLNGDGRRQANLWDPSKDGACEAYGAGGIMRMPGRVHVTWQDDSTLKMETDAGVQTRLLHFSTSTPPAGERELQGYSAAQWLRSGGGGGFGGPGFAGPGGGPAQGRWAPLKVVTTQLRPGWLRKNGVPYSENTVMTEHFISFSDEGTDWFTVVTTIDDPTYLNQSFITSSNFKKESDGSRWRPVPCKAS